MTIRNVRLLAPVALLAALLGFGAAAALPNGAAAAHRHTVLASDGTAIGHNSVGTDGDGTAMGVGRT